MEENKNKELKELINNNLENITKAIEKGHKVIISENKNGFILSEETIKRL